MLACARAKLGIIFYNHQEYFAATQGLLVRRQNVKSTEKGETMKLCAVLVPLFRVSRLDPPRVGVLLLMLGVALFCRQLEFRFPHSAARRHPVRSQSFVLKPTSLEQYL